MWTYLSTWIVQDGELPELRAGSRLIDHGVRASGWLIESTRDTDRLEFVEGPDPDGYDTVTYRLTGPVEWSRPETSEWVIRCEGIPFLARLSNLYPVPRRIGERVSVLCALAVVPDYEWLAFGLPDVRQDWIVEALKVQRRAVEVRDGTGVPADVVCVEELVEMRQWADGRAGLACEYLLDLRRAG